MVLLKVGYGTVNIGLYCQSWAMVLSRVGYGTINCGLRNCQWWAIVLSLLGYGTVNGELQYCQWWATVLSLLGYGTVNGELQYCHWWAIVLLLLGYGTVNGELQYCQWWAIVLSMVGHSIVNDRLRLCQWRAFRFCYQCLFVIFGNKSAQALGWTKNIPWMYVLPMHKIWFKNRTEIQFCLTKLQCSLDQRGGFRERSRRVEEICVVQTYWENRFTWNTDTNGPPPLPGSLKYMCSAQSGVKKYNLYVDIKKHVQQQT
jgi:hypothetical protein